jgi:hypothetical protein
MVLFRQSTSAVITSIDMHGHAHERSMHAVVEWQSSRIANLQMLVIIARVCMHICMSIPVITATQHCVLLLWGGGGVVNERMREEAHAIPPNVTVVQILVDG